jgi:hypothetical protein
MIRQWSVYPSAQAIPESDLPVAGLQECATTPSRYNWCENKMEFYLTIDWTYELRGWYRTTKLLFRGRILGRNPDKSLKFSSLLFKTPLLCLGISISSNSRNLVECLQFSYCTVQVHCKGERRKTWWKTIPPSQWFKNPYRNLESENSQDYAQKPQRNCMFTNSASGLNEIQQLFICARLAALASPLSFQWAALLFWRTWVRIPWVDMNSALW